MESAAGYEGWYPRQISDRDRGTLVARPRQEIADRETLGPNRSSRSPWRRFRLIAVGEFIASFAMIVRTMRARGALAQTTRRRQR